MGRSDDDDDYDKSSYDDYRKGSSYGESSPSRRIPQYHRRRDNNSHRSSGGRRRDRHHHRSRRRRRSHSPGERERSPVRERRRSRSRSLSWSPPPAVRRQMAEAKARKEREAKEGKSGKFWDGFRWVEHTPASQMPSNPATRKERRLYVGNLPLSFDSDQLRVFLNEALRACGAVPEGADQVVVSSWVSPDKKFAFVELSTVEAATTALGLSGITCLGCQLKITYPNNYQMAGNSALLPSTLASLLQATDNQTANATYVSRPSFTPLSFVFHAQACRTEPGARGCRARCNQRRQSQPPNCRWRRWR